MKVSIKNDISYSEIEGIYRTLSKHKNTDLFIPSDLNGKQLGIIAEIIQLTITWSRLSRGKLFSNYDNSTPNLNEKIDEMFRRYWNFVAGSMGYDKGIFLNDSSEISDAVAEVIKERTNYLKINESWKKGDSCFIPSIQHSANPFPSAFYLSNGILKSKKEFIELSKNILLEVATNHKKGISTAVIDFNISLIGEIIYELIENTHFWSQNNYTGKREETGIRGLFASTHYGTKETLLKNCKDDKPLSDYINQSIVNDNSYLIELSIFDSGSGLASTWKNKDISEFSDSTEVYEAIIDCLIKNNTSDENSSYKRGFGLYNIMKLMRNRGYIKLRTNGLKLFRNFNENPFDENDYFNRQNYKLEDWHKTQGKSEPRYRTEGTLFSIFIPLQLNLLPNDN